MVALGAVAADPLVDIGLPLAELLAHADWPTFPG
jgi:hypothetical protein